MKIRNLILLTFGLLPFFGAAQTATFDRVRVRQGLTIRSEKADSIIRAVTALSNHTSIPTAKAVWDAIAAIVAASKYQTLRDDGSNMTQQPAANFVSTGTVAFTLTNDAGNTETEVSAAVPTGGITTTEILDGTIANADISSSANIANSKLANSGVTAGTYPSTGGVIPLLTINSKGIITGVSESPNVDVSATNEGRLGVGVGGSNDALLTSNTSGANGVTIAAGTGIGITETTSSNGGTITLTNTAPENGPDSTWAKSPSGAYTGKRISDNVYRTAKIGLYTKDTTAAITYRLPSPDNVNGFAPVGKKVFMPPRSSFSHPTWTDGSTVWLEQIDPNNMRPKVDTSFKFGVWEDIMVIDSLTNSEVNRPGDLIRDVGFNLSGASSRLARWGWSTEQYYFDGVRDGQNKMSWEHHLQVRDTLGRNTRPLLLRGLHDGSYYDGGMILDVFHISKPHTNRYALNINTSTGAWYTDAPFSFKMQKDTFTSLPLFSKLYSGSYRNLLNMHTNGRTDIGDIFGTRVTDSLSMYASSGAAQAFKITGLGPGSVKWEGKIAQESVNNETYTLTRVGNSARLSFVTSPGNEYGIGINGSSALYFRGTVPATRMTFLSDGNISVNGFSSQTQFTIFQPSLDRNGGIRLNPTTSGNVADIFVNASNEMVIQRTNEALRLANSGQLQLPEYTSSTAFPLTPVATAVFGSDGKIGTAAYSPLAGTGAANRVAYWSGTNNITSSANFLFNGTKASVNTGTAISTYLSLNPNNNASSTALNGGLTLFDNGTNNLYGMDMGYGAAFGPRIFTAASADINFAKVVSGSAPTTQSDFENIMTIKGGTSRVGIGTTGPSEKLHVVGNTLTEGRITSQSTGANAALYLNNTTASTGKGWYINSVNAGDLVIGNPTAADAITINGTTGATTIGGPLTLNTATGTATTLTGRTSSGVFTDVGIGSGLSLSGGTLSATGGGGGTPGGSTTQVQYNNAGAFDGASGLTIDASENVSITQSVFLSGDISPSDISGTANDYAPAGFSTASTLLQTNSNNAVVTGIAGGADGRWITWHNTGANNLIFRNENALSTAANRLLLGGGDVTLRAGGTAGFRYDATASRWRLVYITSFSPSTRVHEFTTGVANYQINIPAGAKGALITGVGGGGGGGSGRKGASATVRCGGGGGASGGIYNMFYPLEGSDAAIMYINVGLGGSGGAAVTANSTNGNAGTAGGETDVRLDGVNLTDRIFRAGGGAGGGGGTASNGTGGTATTVTQIACSAGASASGTGGNGSAPTATLNGTPGPGGSGGGITSANAVGTGGSGAAGAQSLQNGGAANGGAAAAIAKNRDSGGGGGGGNANNTANATTGGAGVRGGGGGGGGAATDSAGNSGAGGAGGDGYLKIIFYF